MTTIISNDNLTVTINDIGAEIISIKGKDKTEYIWQGSPNYWKNHATNLFPICGRLFNGYYTYKGNEYAMILHGFAKISTFTCIESSQTECTFELLPNEETKKMYPFDFSLRIHYTLLNNTIQCDFEVKNNGNETMPFAVGGHPGFNVPLNNNLKFEDYYIDFGENADPQKIILSDTCFTTPNREKFDLLRNQRYLDLKHNLFDNDAIFLEKTPKTFVLKSDKDTHSVTITSNDAKYFGFWHTVKEPAPFVCIEPWIGLPSDDGIVDNLETKHDMVHLQSNETYCFEYSMKFN